MRVDPEQTTKLAWCLALLHLLQPLAVKEERDAPPQVEEGGDACNSYAGPHPMFIRFHALAGRAPATARGDACARGSSATLCVASSSAPQQQ